MLTVAGVLIIMFTFLLSAFASIPLIGSVQAFQLISDNARILYGIGIFLFLWGVVRNPLISISVTLVVMLLLTFVLKWI